MSVKPEHREGSGPREVRTRGSGKVCYDRLEYQTALVSHIGHSELQIYVRDTRTYPGGTTRGERCDRLGWTESGTMVERRFLGPFVQYVGSDLFRRISDIERNTSHVDVDRTRNGPGARTYLFVDVTWEVALSPQNGTMETHADSANVLDHLLVLRGHIIVIGRSELSVVICSVKRVAKKKRNCCVSPALFPLAACRRWAPSRK